MKNSSDTIGNQTRDLLTCSSVPQLTALPCAPYLYWYKSSITHWVGECGWRGGCVRYFVERDHLGSSTVDWRVMLK